MMTLVMEISKIIAQSASELFVWLEETYNISIDETAAKWSELTGMNITIRDGSEPELKSAKVTKKSESKVKKIPKIKDTKDLDVHLCQHMFQIGAKAGEQCSKKPKYGSFCTAHTKKAKTSVKSGKEEPKKKKEKVVDHDEIDSNFESADDKKKKSKSKSKKKSPSKAELSNTDSEEEVPLKLKKLKIGVDPITGKKTTISSEEETDDEPTVKPTPLLNKKSKGKKPPMAYDTDDEKIDANLDLSEDEE